MYRIAQKNQELILRFWPKLNLTLNQKEEICRAFTGCNVKISEIASDGSALLFVENVGAVALDVERMPSLVLTVTAVVPKNRWFNYREL
ncbi:hypothetical protein [Bacillus sp. EB01]|uniref:hypothetical protein n=1 Tax=Bacillus sp. EB01 TaxID=1347086 RepID=UPI0005C75E10|nr:hypothetical protein [Bacillus sp. EB01]